ncbi:MAG: glycosyltransferase family 2 protein [Ruminococcaceae bacterium]|nr:glycosyltransferase family 2 protein [Oscillospiraceae bacterium]
MPQISVIVPVYKVEAYLHECVDSILAQTFSDFELILVDDGSPDNCGKICDEYAAKDNRIRVIHQENQGLSGARNAGIDIARGEYITFIDSDDLVDMRYLEILLDTAKEGAAVAVCRHREFSDSNQLTAWQGEVSRKTFDTVDAVETMYNGSVWIPVNACGKLICRGLIGDTRFPVGRLHEDQAFTPYILYRAEKTVSCNAILYHYRVNPVSITRNTFSLRRYDDLWAIEECIRFFEECGEDKIVAAARKKRQRLICTYAIYAKRDGVQVPEAYRISIPKALGHLRRNVSADKYGYYLALVNEKLVIWDAYLRKIEKIFRKQV